MALLDLLGRRMTLRILWELGNRRLTFRALLAAADTNPSVLNVRLKELSAARLVARGEGGYGLTPHGRALLQTLLPLNRWANAWGELFSRRRPRPPPRAPKRDLPARP
jgi:DNA-binding HxlR family transcriptional regulator